MTRKRNFAGVSDPLLGSDLLTTGVLARLCRVSPRTVLKWTENGLASFRLPCTEHRRIRRCDAVAFLRARGVPVPPELSQDATLLVSDDAILTAAWRQSLGDDLVVVGAVLAAGAVLVRQPIWRLVYDTQLVTRWEVLRERPHLRTHHPRLVVVALLGDDAEPDVVALLEAAGVVAFGRRELQAAC